MQPLAGCFVGYEKPDAALDVPARYQEAGRRAPHAAMPALDWWRGFRSGELTALMEEALTANFDIAAAVARIRAADAQARISGAPLLPIANLNAFAQRSRASQTTNPGGGISSGPSERTLYSTSLSASYEIDFWGKNRASLLAAEETAVAARFEREVVAITTLASVGNTYFLVLAAQDRLRIARNNVRAATRILTLLQERLAAGTASALDIAQQETIVDTQRATIPPFEQLKRESIATLALLIGRAPEFVTIRGGSMSRIATPRVTPGLPSELLTQRPDIRQAEALARRRQRQCGVGARRVLPEHPADRRRRLPERRAQDAVQSGVGLLPDRRRPDAADPRRLPAARRVRTSRKRGSGSCWSFTGNRWSRASSTSIVP